MSDNSHDLDRHHRILKITCTGLKPSTIHLFYDANVNMGANCVPVSPSSGLGDPLVTNADGKIIFEYHLTMARQRDEEITKLFEIKANHSFAAKFLRIIE